MTSDASTPRQQRAIGRRGLLGLAGAAGLGALTAPGTAHAEGAARPAPLPVPPGSRGPKLNADGYSLTEIGDRVFGLGDGAYQMVFMVTDEGVVALDAPPTLGNNIMRAIRTVTRRPVSHVVYSHSHADHIGAASLYPSTATRVSHRRTAQLLARDADPNRPAPTVTYTDSLRLSIGGRAVHLDYQGPNHSPDNSYIWLPDSKVLMLVDVIFPGWTPFHGLGFSEDLPGWIDAHDKALAYPFEMVVGGHLTRNGTRGDAETQREYVLDLQRRCRRLIEEFDPTPVFEREPSDNPWAIFDDYLETIAGRAAEGSVDRFRDRLAATDIFGADNAFFMIQTLRIDSGVLGPFSIRP